MAALIAAWTSCPAASILRESSNWIEITEMPMPLTEVSWATPDICANCRSSGLATDDAMVSGLVPGNWAVT